MTEAFDLVLFDDALALAWRPFSLTRPAGELMYGAFTMRARAERVFRARCIGHVTAPHLAGFEEPGAPPVVATWSFLDAGGAARTAVSDLPTDRARLFLNARAVPAWDAAFAPPAGAAEVRIGNVSVGRWVPAGAPSPPEDDLLAKHGTRAVVALPGVVLERTWQLMSGSPAQLERDIAAAAPPAEAAHGVSLLGPADRLRLGKDVVVEPNVVIDVTHGPVWLDDGVTVRAFTRLVGPSYVGPGSTLLGGPYEAVTIGPRCKVHGEIEESVVLGYSNKAHDGFLGHAYLGRWVNLGALTTNSDLKNNYGSIRLWTMHGEVDTGEIKVGCFLGDHVKTGIGVMLNTGTVVGAGANIFGAVQPPKYVPPFRWGAGDALVEYDLARFLDTAKTVMGRRGVELTDGMRAMLTEAWRIGRTEAT
jgi:UDP-N-acetylglucosamine diphosphorylase / glucose-1-phosphate thymidylyltransferase / UDP-N-acetylgalactosamine diphosphorylase / glucosamine-1-phosphate N-acetyltransferase / galactosamine-1-phosphate N-acetyltransferase